MANHLQKVRELIAELPAGNSMRALQSVTGWLDSLNEARDLDFKSRLAVVDLLDRAAKYHQFRLAPEYLEAPRLQKLYESRLWNTSFGFWKALGSSYLHCIERYESGASGSDGMAEDMSWVTGRALRSLGIQLKWILLRYALVEARIWRDVGRAYLFAERHGFAARRAQIYPGKHGESTAQEEFLKVLMLAASSPDGLPPLEIHIAERVVAHFASSFRLRQTSARTCHFRFDLSSPLPPARSAKNAPSGPMVRFFGAGEALEALRDLVHVTREKDGISVEIPLGGTFETKTVAAVLGHLGRYWGESPPQRGAKRRDMAMRVTVVRGFAEALNWAKAVTDETSLEFSDPPDAESWIVFNASDGGYGAVIPKLKGDWLHVGCLVGLRAETSNLCRVGIVRRITRDVYDQRRVGIQLLESTAFPVALSARSTTQSGGSEVQAEPAILLSSRTDPNRGVAFLVRTGFFSAKRQLQMVLRAKSYSLEPLELIEAGEDFDWVRCRVVSADSSRQA